MWKVKLSRKRASRVTWRVLTTRSSKTHVNISGSVNLMKFSRVN